MQYIIYLLETPDVLTRHEPDGYYMKTTYRNALVELDEYGIESRHDSMESAIQEIEKNAKKLEGSSLTILPVISISWNGEIQ